MSEPLVVTTYTASGYGFAEAKRNAIAMLEAELKKLQDERRQGERRGEGRRR